MLTYDLLENGEPFDFSEGSIDSIALLDNGEPFDMMDDNNNVAQSEENWTESNTNSFPISPEINCNNETFKRLYPHVVVVGIGDSGCNSINYLSSKTTNIKLIKIDSDADSLNENRSGQIECIQLGEGQGSGGKIEKVTNWMKQKEDDIKEALNPYRLVFVVAALGGGTGSGAIPYIAELCRHKMNKMVICLVYTPDCLQSKESIQKSNDVLTKIEENDLCNTLMTISNDRLVENQEGQENRTMSQAYENGHEEALKVLSGLELLLDPRNKSKIDFNDLREFLSRPGKSFFNSIVVEHNDIQQRVEKAYEQIKADALIDSENFDNAKGVILNVRLPEDILTTSFRWLTKKIKELEKRSESNESNAFSIKSSYTKDDRMPANTLRLTYIVTGIEYKTGANKNQPSSEASAEKGDSSPKNPSLNHQPPPKLTDNQLNLTLPPTKKNNHQVSDEGAVEFHQRIFRS